MPACGCLAVPCCCPNRSTGPQRMMRCAILLEPGLERGGLMETVPLPVTRRPGSRESLRPGSGAGAPACAERRDVEPVLCPCRGRRVSPLGCGVSPGRAPGLDRTHLLHQKNRAGQWRRSRAQRMQIILVFLQGTSAPPELCATEDRRPVGRAAADQHRVVNARVERCKGPVDGDMRLFTAAGEVAILCAMPLGGSECPCGS